jgi:hypothetical protein
MIAATKPGRLVGSPEQGVDFGTTQEVNQAASVPLPGNGENTLDLGGTGALLFEYRFYG